ncbi:MAG TPA: NADH-quinone oxidoreductase subunit L, partial [Polyangiaceae bacterium]|nr:NADH-quinone oxidoreductase subunit L [Polyangiaceae bacterium]
RRPRRELRRGPAGGRRRGARRAARPAAGRVRAGPPRAAGREGPRRRRGAAEGCGAAGSARPDGAERARAPRAAAAGLPDRSLAFRDLERIVAQRRDVPRRQWLGVDVLTLAALLLFAGAMGKSAQVPLHVWLPDAMAGPTPVSALIHAATMVTAGVYLVARMHFVFATSPVAMTVVTMVGAFTALFAATIGVFQHDIKKVLAYSTVSQLGFMFVAVGVGAYWVGIFHLMTHAFFKACLFLGSGSVILGCHHEQDMRRMGGLRKLMPLTAVTYLLSCFAIAGFPPFSGFFSKDEILWRAFDAGNLLLPGGGLIPGVLITVAALLTSFYMFRSYFLTFSGSYRGGAHAADGAPGHGRLPHESPWSMTGVLAVLAALAVVGGFVGLPLLWGLPNWFERWLEPVFAGSHHRIESGGYGHGLEWALMALSVAVAVTGFVLARWLYRDGSSPIPARLLASESPAVRGVHRWVYGKYFVDELYELAFVRAVREGARALAVVDARVVDGIVNLCGAIGRACGAVQGLIDRWFVDGIVNLVGDTLVFGGRALRTIQTGLVQAYLYVALAGAVVLILIAYAVQ